MTIYRITYTVSAEDEEAALDKVNDIVYQPDGIVRRRGLQRPLSLGRHARRASPRSSLADAARHDDCTAAHNCGEHPEWQR